jgi:GNAT superfamily N-acetyltransferase
MRVDDLPRVGDLSAELGYPADAPALSARFARLAADPGDALFVAERDGRVVGWIHAHPRWLLESEPYAEIGGLVVDARAQRSGAGRALVEEVVRWATGQGLARVRVRSDVRREAAHAFYPALGFAVVKTQHTYDLLLARG